MDRFDRIFALHRVLAARRTPIPMDALTERLECSPATVKRTIRDMRDHLNAPIEAERGRGYYYARNGGEWFDLPGLWFNAAELHALLTMQALIRRVGPGILSESLEPVARRIQQLLDKQGAGEGEVAGRIRILAIANRTSSPECFDTAAESVLQRRRIEIEYRGRSTEETTERTVSPQRLTHYRDNWYLDAWCHRAQDLRIFALDRIQRLHRLDQPARDVPAQELDERLSSSYGIFAGPPSGEAVLRFSPKRARWVAEERWHSEQQGAFLDDGRYELRVPFSDPTELILDILRYGPDVEVIEPAELRASVAKRLREAADIYT